MRSLLNGWTMARAAGLVRKMRVAAPKTNWVYGGFPSTDVPASHGRHPSRDRRTATSDRLGVWAQMMAIIGLPPEKWSSLK